MSKECVLKPIDDYESRGGFATAIVNAWFVADSKNRAAIESQWGHLFELDHASMIAAGFMELVMAAKLSGYVVSVRMPPEGGNESVIVSRSEA